MTTLNEMTLLELAEYWNKDKPELEQDSVMREWTKSVNAGLFSASELECLQFLHELKDVDYIDEIVKVRDSFREFVNYELSERVDKLEESVKVLLKHLGSSLANITVEELNRERGGL